MRVVICILSLTALEPWQLRRGRVCLRKLASPSFIAKLLVRAPFTWAGRGGLFQGWFSLSLTWTRSSTPVDGMTGATGAGKCMFLSACKLLNSIAQWFKLASWPLICFWRKWYCCCLWRTVFYGQYKCSGPGADFGKRVSWSRELTQLEAKPFVSIAFVDGHEWLTSLWPRNRCNNLNIIAIPHLPLSPWIFQENSMFISKLQCKKISNHWGIET